MHVNKSQRPWQRVAFLVLLFLSCLIAVLVGPATAVLMIPRTLDWKVGGGIYWVNGKKISRRML
jgi:hypothetical protein